jgi:hypothetical protein
MSVSPFLASNYFFYGESLVEQFGVVINRGDFLPFLVRHHRFISFAMYIIGEIFFHMPSVLWICNFLTDPDPWTRNPELRIRILAGQLITDHH